MIFLKRNILFNLFMKKNWIDKLEKIHKMKFFMISFQVDDQ